MNEPDGKLAVEMSELCVDEPEEEADGDEEAVDDGRQKQEGHRNSDQSENDAERFAPG